MSLARTTVLAPLLGLLLPGFLLLGLLPVAAPAGEDEVPLSPGGPVTENRLARERSPYLRQHGTNPVDWYPWGSEALERAAREDRPLFVSVGYAACHWCHVMEHESFEDEETARLLNETFVCVKVDREERPDLDRVYMTAVQLMTGRGGWPMTVLCLPDGRPFWGGTYLPRETLQDLTGRVREAWRTQRAAVTEQAAKLAGYVKEQAAGTALPASDVPDGDLVAGVVPALRHVFDARRGGYGTRPKFPPHGELLFLLDRLEAGDPGAGAPGDAPEREDAREQVRRTLEAMEEGGIHDHVGGGFHRYSTDERWLLPHFEKMLYDNALLAQAYARAHAVTKDPRFTRVARRILAWVKREMARPGGGYASSLDADTEGEEGLTYTWTVAEVRAALPAADADLALRCWGLAEGGNFQEESTGHATGRNILHLPAGLAATAAREGMTEEALLGRLDALATGLHTAREKRPQPGLDDKVIVGWNGLLLSAFAVVGSSLGDATALADARALASFLLDACRRPDGTLLRFPRGSGPEIPAFCEDHVHVLEGLLDLADATGEARWAKAAGEVAEHLLAEFEDREGGGFWATSSRLHEVLFARAKEAWDSPIPSDQGSAARALLRLFRRTGEERYRVAADRTLAAYRPLMAGAGAARGVVALLRALADRVALDAAGPSPAEEVRGDVHLRQGVAAVDVYLERGEAARGSRVRLAIRVALDEGWHVNANPATEDFLVPTTLRVAAGGPVGLSEVTYPQATRHAAGGLPALDLYEGRFWIRGTLDVPAGAPMGPRKVVLLLGIQACDGTSCRAPEEVRLEVPLRFAPEDGPSRHAPVFRR